MPILYIVLSMRHEPLNVMKQEVGDMFTLMVEHREDFLVQLVGVFQIV